MPHETPAALRLWLAACCALILTAGSSPAQDWPQWRGPARDGQAENFTPPESWPETIRKKWQVEVGTGHSSPVTNGKKAYLLSRQGEEEVVRAFDLATGQVLWRQAYMAPYQVNPSAYSHGSGPKSTPVVGGRRICTLGIGGILSCFDTETGRRLWQKDFAGRFSQAAPPFGASMSPLMSHGWLIAHVGGHHGGAIVAFDPATGEEEWTLVGEGPGYSSPIIAELDGQAQLVTQAHRQIMGVDPSSGEFLWKVPFATPCDQNVVTPILAGNQLIFSSLVHGTFAVTLAKEAGAWKPEISWHNRDLAMYMSSPVLVDGRLIGMARQRRGQFFALDSKTGSTAWTSPGRQADNAALVAAGNSVLILTDDAELLVLPAASESYKTTARYQVASSPTWAHPVPTAHGVLIKDQSSLSMWSLGPESAPQAAKGR